MSDEKNKGGFGPKRPTATFGDVMLGIPSGRGGEKEGRGGGRDQKRGDRRDEKRPQGAPASGEGQSAAPSEGDRKGGRGDRGGKRGGGEAREPKAAKGPMVVVKRASGVIETRAPESTDAAAPSEASAPEAAAEQAPVERAPKKVVPSGPTGALYDEVPETQSFEEMFEAQSKQDGGPSRRFPRIGEKVSGTIFQLGADTAFISLGTGKSEAMIELRELKDDEGILRFGVGDTIEAHVIEAGARGIVLTKSLTKGSATMGMLAEARASGMPVEGLVLSVNKGGLEIAIGDVRAFCPVSQIDVRFVEKPETFVGEKLKFRVTEVREKNVVLSRRALLEEEQKAKAAETRKQLEQGKVLKGTVISVRDFGAFVDLGGLEAMIPVSELSHVRVGHPSEVVKVGDLVEVEVLRIEAANPNSPDKAKQKERITLSMRSRMEDPFKAVLAEIHEGDRLKGKIVRLQPFGAFVELRPGVDGLIHISALSNRRIAHPKDVVKVGDEVEVSVEKIDPNEKRIGLRLVTPENEAAIAANAEARAAAPSAPREQAPRPKVGQVVEGTIDRIEPYGVFLAFPGGKGLVPGERDRHRARHRHEAPLPARPDAQGRGARDRLLREDPALGHRRPARRRAGGHRRVEEGSAQGHRRQGLRHLRRPAQGPEVGPSETRGPAPASGGR